MGARLNGNQRRRLYQLKCCALALELGQVRQDLANTQERAAKLAETVSTLRKQLEANDESRTDVPGTP